MIDNSLLVIRCCHEMYTPSLFCLSLPLSQATVMLALFLVLLICDLFQLLSVTSLSFVHGLPIDIQYCCLDLKVWAFHKNGIYAVLNIVSALFVPHSAKIWFAFWNDILSQIWWCQKIYEQNETVIGFMYCRVYRIFSGLKLLPSESIVMLLAGLSLSFESTRFLDPHNCNKLVTLCMNDIDNRQVHL